MWIFSNRLDMEQRAVPWAKRFKNEATFEGKSFLDSLIPSTHWLWAENLLDKKAWKSYSKFVISGAKFEMDPPFVDVDFSDKTDCFVLTFGISAAAKASFVTRTLFFLGSKNWVMGWDGAEDSAFLVLFLRQSRSCLNMARFSKHWPCDSCF